MRELIIEFETARNRYVDELKSAAEQMIQEKWKELNRKGIKVTSHVKTGDPADRIDKLNQVLKQNFSLVTYLR